MHGFVQYGKVHLRDLQSQIRTFVHKRSGLRLVVGSTPGPLCQATIVVSTVPENDKGLPHTLEHLIFCGSRSFPHRGYLDHLATRCLAEGTNAWTSDEYTAYTVSTAGTRGMLSILPVFLDHVLHPLLHDEHFNSEVYHVTPEGHEQGVVFSEMSARENTEDDMMDASFRKLLFEKSTYVHDAGGATPEIARLSMEEIRDYHTRYYRPENITVLLTGQLDVEKVIECLSVDYLPEIFLDDHAVEASPAFPLKATENGGGESRDRDIQNMIRLFTTIPPLEGDKHSVVHFPAADEEFGSITFGWRGPRLEDYETNLALDVLAKYLVETETSLLVDQFVERRNPASNDVDFNCKSFPETGIQLTFSGVPYLRDGESSAEDSAMEALSQEGHSDVESFDETSSDMATEGSCGSSSECMLSDEEASDVSTKVVIDNGLLFTPNYLKDHIFALFRAIVEKGFPEGPHALLPVLRRMRRNHFFQAWENNPHGLLCDFLLPELLILNATPLTDRVMRASSLGERVNQLLPLLDHFEKLPLSYWQQLLKTYFLDADCIQVFMLPDRALAARNAAAQRERRVQLARPTEKTKPISAPTIDHKMPALLLSGLPSLPSSASIPRWQACQFNEWTLTPLGCQRIETETSFLRMSLFLRLDRIPHRLRPYLLLFQEMLFNSPLLIPTVNPTSSHRYVPFNDVVNGLHSDLLHYSASVGFRQDVFQCQSLSNMMIFNGVAERHQSQALCTWLCDVLFYSVFELDRLLPVTKNLLSALSEMKRDGAEMLDHYSAWLTESSQGGSNERFTSPFVQESVLKHVLNQLSEGHVEHVQTALLELRKVLLQDILGSFVQFSGPQSTTEELQQIFREAWTQRAVSQPSAVQSVSGTLTFPGDLRHAYGGKALRQLALLAVDGCDSAYLATYVPCDVMRTDDYYSVMVLVELLNRTEGPLYTAVRGAGHAYHVDVQLAMWAGQLILSIHQASALQEALVSSHRVLASLKEKRDEILSLEEIETAKASVLYRHYADQSTPSQLVREMTLWTLVGFPRFSDYEAYASQVHTVNQQSLLRVYDAYFLPLFSKTCSSLSVVTANPVKLAELRTDLQAVLDVRSPLSSMASVDDIFSSAHKETLLST